MIATSSFFVAASSLFTLALGVPLPRSLAERSVYSVFGGDGSPAAGWPDTSAWISFDDLWKVNEPIMRKSCSSNNWGPDNDENEIAAIRSALEATGKKTSIKKEFLLAVMIQESKGCVRAPTTNYGVRNPGLFQDFNGHASCNDGSMIYPCPAATITQMVEEGAGIGLEFGLQQALGKATAKGAGQFYQAARIYNSGSLPATGNLGQGVATHCYVSDIANRLLGWDDDKHSCDEATVSSMTASASNGNRNDPTDDKTNNLPKKSEVSPSPVKAAPLTTPTGSGDSNPIAPETPGPSTNCKKWYEIKPGDNCSNLAVSFEILRKLNNNLDSQCSNLWLGSSYCIAA